MGDTAARQRRKSAVDENYSSDEKHYSKGADMQRLTFVGLGLLISLHILGALVPALGQQRFDGREIVRVNWKGKQIECVDGRFTLQLFKGTDKGKIESRIVEQGGRIIHVMDDLLWIAVQFTSQSRGDTTLSELKSNKMIAWYEPDAVGRADMAVNDPLFPNQWGLKNIGQNPPGGEPGADVHIEQAWDITQGSAETKLAILDTGIPLRWVDDPEEGYYVLSHPDLSDQSRITLGYNFTTEGGPLLVQDLEGHGTHVAGIAGAETNNQMGVAGVAPGTGLLIVKIGSQGGYAAQSSVYSGTVYAVDHGASVVNLSFSWADQSNDLWNAVAYANSHNVLFVTTAGNNYGGPVRYPAGYSSSFSNLIAVGGSDSHDNRSSLSAIGPEVCLVAPAGVNAILNETAIISTYPDYAYHLQQDHPELGLSYGYLSGTSMAAPHVAGVAALMKTLNPLLQGAEIRSIIQRSADWVPGMGVGNTFTNEYGHGRLNAYQALLLTLAQMNKSTLAVATSGNNQRKLYRESSGTLHEVFESGNEVFYRQCSAGTQNWGITSRLSPGSGGSNAPCITMAGASILVIYQRLTGSSYSIEVSRSTNGGSAWSSLPSLGSFTCDSPGPMPTISALGNSVFVGYRTYSGGLMWNRSLDGGATWNVAATVPGTSASCNSPSSLMYNTYWAVPQANLAYATDIPTGSPRIYYKWYDFDTGTWGSTIDLTSIVPSNFSHHANPCIAVAPNTSGGRDVHTAWDAALDLPPTRVVIHRKNPFRSSGSVYNVLWDYGWTKPTISCVGENLLWMLCQNSASGAIRRRYYDGTSWGAGTTVTGSGRDPQLSVQFGGSTASAKYVYTTGSQSPFPVVLGSESLSKTAGTVVYTRALNVIDSATRASVTMELGVPQIETKSGGRIPINFTSDINDTVKFDIAMLLKSGATEEFTIPPDAASLILPVAIYGKNPSVVFGNKIGTLGVGVTDSRGGTVLATIGNTLSTAVQDVALEPSEIRLPLQTGITGQTSLKLVPLIGSIRTDREMIFSLGHIYKTVGGDSLGKAIPLMNSDAKPTDYEVSQNYPNPFNPSTTIRYGLPSRAHVTLAVFNTLGQQVATLIQGEQKAGYHEVRFDGSTLPSGIYFYRIQAGTFTDTKKLLLVR